MGGLMKVMPFASVCYVIAGLASLGLPALSGFVAEMTVFVGAFEHADLFRRVLTIVAATSIVVTAVYILRTVGKILYGPAVNPEHLTPDDARWYERVAAVVLIAGIATIGVWPSGVQEVIWDSLEHINIL
jgi:NADH-quinone oxidoreductase subunit M